MAKPTTPIPDVEAEARAQMQAKAEAEAAALAEAEAKAKAETEAADKPAGATRPAAEILADPGRDLTYGEILELEARARTEAA
jgi:hypothetical protein